MVFHWNGHVSMLMKFLSLAALQVILTTSSTAIGEKVINMTLKYTPVAPFTNMD